MENSAPGDISFEIPLSEPNLTSVQFGPYRTDWYLYRIGQGSAYSLLEGGMLTSVNLNGDRDSVLVRGKSFMHYLERRIYPFSPVQYADPNDPNNWRVWPKQWVTPPIVNGQGNPMELRDIVEDLLEAIETSSLVDLPGGVTGGTDSKFYLGLVYNNPASGLLTKHKIYPGDQTNIYEHIKKLSEQVNGFEFDVLPGTKEFKMYYPVPDSNPVRISRDRGNAVYRFTVSEDETRGAVIEADWTNDGPEGTVLMGIGQLGENKVGQSWWYRRSVQKYRWLDKVYDFGSIQYAERLLQMLKDQNDLYPQEKLALTILNPEYLTPSFYTGGRPRNLIGNRIQFNYTWAPFWPVNHYFKVNKITWDVDQSTNERVTLDLEIIYESDPELL